MFAAVTHSITQTPQEEEVYYSCNTLLHNNYTNKGPVGYDDVLQLHIKCTYQIHNWTKIEKSTVTQLRIKERFGSNNAKLGGAVIHIV